MSAHPGTDEKVARKRQRLREVRDDPLERKRAQWRLSSHKRRRRDDDDEYVYGIQLPELLVVAALTATHPDRREKLIRCSTRIVRALCAELLRPLVVEALLRVSHDVTNTELKVDIEYMLKGFRR